MPQRAQKRLATSHTEVAGKTIRRMALVSRNIRMSVNITAIGRMVAAMVKVS